MKKIFFILLLVLLLSSFLQESKVFGHPHVRIYSRLEFEFAKEKCLGFSVEWRFDGIFGTTVIREFDKDRNGSFSEKEIKRIYSEAFTNLKNYGYFVFLRKGNTRKHPEKIENFSAEVKNGHLIYKFFIPVKPEEFGKDFSVAIFDRAFYCDIQYEENPVSMKLISGMSPEHEIAANKKYPVYYNPLGSPEDMTIHKKWKPGLDTAYPVEVRVFFRQQE